VFQAVHIETGEEIAVKVIRKKVLPSEGIALMEQEAELLKSIDHPRVVKFKHVSHHICFFNFLSKVK